MDIINITTRTIEVKLGDLWSTCSMLDLTNGAIFRMFDGSIPVIDQYNQTEWIVDGDPFICSNGVPAVNVLNKNINGEKNGM